MNTEAASQVPLTTFEQLCYAREIMEIEARSLRKIAGHLDNRFCEAIKLLLRCRGNLIVSGMGKAGLIGQKIAATFASTGTHSHFLHPGEAYHGDLGRIHPEDLVLLLSQSGETEEVLRLLPSLVEFGVPIVAITGHRSSRLGRAASVPIEMGSLQEACALGLAPSTSTTVMLALGDALALVTSRMRGFRAEDFARFHPGGSLGRQLSKVEDCMRPLADCRLAQKGRTVRDVFVSCTKPGRRTGAIMLTDKSGRLVGLFTDSDLARLFENHHENSLDGPISSVMTKDPSTVSAGSLLRHAVETMLEEKISELPIVDDDGKPLGLIDLTDVATLPPAEGLTSGSRQPSSVSDNSSTEIRICPSSTSPLESR